MGVDRGLTSEVVLTGTQAVEKAGKNWADKPWVDKSNAGYSGTPMWKLALEGKEAAAVTPSQKIPEGFKPTQKGGEWYYNEKRQVFWRVTDNQMYVWDDIAEKHAPLHEAKTYDLRSSVGACFHESAMQVRHLMVRDLQKAGTSLRMSLDHLDKPCALYALYEGHRSVGQGNVCADFCVKNFHLKLLPKLAAYRGYWEDERLRRTMQESFQELDAEFLEKQHSKDGKSDGCSAAVALLMGGRVVVASVGDVACLVCMRSGEANELVKPHAVKDEDDDEDWDDDDLDEAGGGASSSTAAPPPTTTLSSPTSASANNNNTNSSALALSTASAPNAAASASASLGDAVHPPEEGFRWTRCMGNAEYKGANNPYRLEATPEVVVLQLLQRHQGVAFVCRELYNAIGRAVAVSTVFKRSAGRPRMAAGSLLDAAVQWLGQVTDHMCLGSIVVQFDQSHEASTHEGPPSAKRAKKEDSPSQVRVRHILLKHRECKNSVDKVRNKQVKRTRMEAERSLRAALEAILAPGEMDKKIFTQKCKELSECQSCLKSGDLVGDLGWVKPGKFGQTFDDVAFSLRVGQLSDLVDSDQGVHVIFRTA